MTPGELRDRLRQEGITQREIARRVRRSEALVSRVVNGAVVSRRVMLAISEAIAVPPSLAFPAHTRLFVPGPELISHPANGAMSDCDPDSAPRVAGASG